MTGENQDPDDAGGVSEVTRDTNSTEHREEKTRGKRNMPGALRRRRWQVSTEPRWKLNLQVLLQVLEDLIQNPTDIWNNKQGNMEEHELSLQVVIQLESHA